MEFQVEAVARVPPEDAWRWWTDFGRAGQTMTVSHAPMMNTRRTIVTASAEEVVMEDAAPFPGLADATRMRRVVEIHPSGKWLLEKVEKPVPMESRWEFLPANDGRATRIRRVTTVRSAAADKAKAVAGPAARKMAEVDLKHHVKELEKQVGRR